MTTRNSDHARTPGPENAPGPAKARAGSAADMPAEVLAPPDIDPETSSAEEDDEARLPELSEDSLEAVAEGTLSAGHAAIEKAVRLAPTSTPPMTCSTSARRKTSASGSPPMRV